MTLEQLNWYLTHREKIGAFQRYIRDVEREFPNYLEKVSEAAALKAIIASDQDFRIGKHRGADAGIYWYLPGSADEQRVRGIWIELWMPRHNVEWLVTDQCDERSEIRVRLFNFALLPDFASLRSPIRATQPISASS